MNSKQNFSPSQIFESEKTTLKAKLAHSSSKSLEKLGRYKIVEELGRGGMGCVYKAFDPNMGKHIALKTMLSGMTKKELERFMIEARALAKFRHANIVRIYDISIEDDIPYLTMDLVQGLSLKEYLQKTPLNIRHFAGLMVKISKAIAYAHEQSIIHRDLKPANIMIENLEPQIMDFGLAKINSAEKSLSKTGTVIGTPKYMSPEQARGEKVTYLTDIYALGACFYEMLAGRPLIEGQTPAEIIYQVIHKEPKLLKAVNNKLSLDLEAICYKAVVKEKSKRYQNASEFARDIERFLNGEVIQARHVSIWEQSWKKFKKNKLILAVATIGILLVVFAPLFVKNYQKKELKKAAKNYLQKANSIIFKINSVKNKELQIRLWIKACNYLENALDLAKNNAKIKKKFFNAQKKIAELAKEQKNYLLSYVFYKRCKKLGYAQANTLLKNLEKEQGEIKQKHIAFIEKIMKKIATKVKGMGFLQQKQVLNWYMFKIIKIEEPYVVKKLIGYLHNKNKWQRILAIQALGRLQNNYTKVDAKDSVEWLLELLAKFKGASIENQLQEVEQLIWALGWLKDQRAYVLVYEIRLQEENSILSGRTIVPSQLIPANSNIMNMHSSFFDRGLVKQTKKDYLGAIADYSKAIELNPRNFKIYDARGSAYKEQKDYQRAIADYSRAIKLNPQYFYAYNNRANVYQKQKDYQRAIVDYSKAIELNPQYFNTYNNRAYAYLKQKNYRKAMADYSKVIALKPKNSRAYSGRAIVYKWQRKYSKAIVDFSKAIEFDPLYSEAYINRANVYRVQKNYIAAVADCSFAIRINPRNVLAYNSRGRIYHEQKNYEKAIADFSKAIKWGFQNEKVYYNRGLAYDEQKNYTKAIADYSMAIELNPRFLFAYNNRGVIYNAQKKYKKAIDDYSKAITFGYAFSYYGRGVSYQKLKNYEKGYRDFLMFLQHYPTHPLATKIHRHYLKRK